jgi:hyperosmotically inducible periplasmic protein
MHRSGSTGALMLALAFMVTLTVFTAACGKSVGETIDDAGITAQVKTALLNDPDVGGLRIDVDTSKGLVTLSGVVKSKNEEAKAIAIARKVDGVKDVKSTLQVSP